MQAWLPIMTRYNGKVLFIDAFAGPGEYAGGEPGSPVIALKALIGHRAQSTIRSQVHFLFIEKDRARSECLERILSSLADKLPAGCSYQVITSTFNDTLTSVLDNIEEQRVQLAPAFVMIDPFGVSETPMETVARILENPKSEVYISFMYEWINRFKREPSFERALDKLFGCSEWRQGRDLADPKDRKDFFHDLYSSQLKKNGAQYTVHFELYEGQEFVYSIFFGTKNLDGCDKMKQAIWKIAPLGDFRFKSNRLGQLILGPDVVDFGLLEKALVERFGLREWQKIANVEEFVKSDATDFHSGQLKMKTLKPLEVEGKIEAKQGTRKRPRTYPKGTVLRFL